MTYRSRADAVNGYRNSYGRYLRDLADRTSKRAFLARYVDLADLPSDLADHLERSDAAWRRFLDDVIKAAGA